MKNLLKNRIVVGLLCIITAFIICFGLTPMFNDALKSKVELVRVSSEIKKGDQITAGMITTVETGGYNLPSDVVYKANEVVGKYANADLYKGDYILKTKLSDTPMLKNEYLSGLDGTNRAISVTIKSFAAGLSGKLERGDIVSLIASDVGEMRETLIPTELQYVEIIATTDSSGNDSNIQEQPKDSEDTELASTITVLATPEQATLLAELEQTGKLHAALVYRGGSENAQKFLDEQTKVLEALYPVKSKGLTYESENNNSTAAPAASDSSVGEAESSAAPAAQD
ncbi:Flp pilus assembly protein CpaB [Lacrimispora sp.]|uniref:Flp pilus assembly protein CpaB n=1 Tax=Lacrimispora sp. TaxID=2719234 RepID=UPI0028966841|nr:RcpC/CpaB family pilus assembly protein [Lacrimispora sp.]